MIFDTLISAHSLQQNSPHPDWVIINCRFSLTNTELGAYKIKM